MGKIVYNNQTIEDAKIIINDSNSNILESLKKIELELTNINQVLNTPKSNKTMIDIIELLDKDINYVDKKKQSYENMLNTITSGYQEYLDLIKGIVGVNNDQL